MRLIKFFKKCIINLFSFLKKLVLAPFKWLKKSKKTKKTNTTKIDTIKSYIKIANDNKLEISIVSNYDNELIVQLHTPNTTKTKAKRVKETSEETKEKQAD